MTFTRISINPAIMAGVPCITGTRIPVATIVACFASGMAEAEILKAYPQLAVEDLREALWYAAEAVTIETLPAVSIPEEGTGGRVPA
jgi:uncharacterized protein (DUF433 family)